MREFPLIPYHHTGQREIVGDIAMIKCILNRFKGLGLKEAKDISEWLTSVMAEKGYVVNNGQF